MFKFIIILILVVFLLGRLFKFLLKYALIGVAHKHTNGNFNGNSFNGDQSKSQNSVHKERKPNSGKSGGEYIDYEIIK